MFLLETVAYELVLQKPLSCNKICWAYFVARKWLMLLESKSARVHKHGLVLVPRSPPAHTRISGRVKNNVIAWGCCYDGRNGLKPALKKGWRCNSECNSCASNKTLQDDDQCSIGVWTLDVVMHFRWCCYRWEESTKRSLFGWSFRRSLCETISSALVYFFE